MIKSISQCFHSVRTENVGIMLQPKLRATLGPVCLWSWFLYRWLWPHIRSQIDKGKLNQNLWGFLILHQKYKDPKRQICYREAQLTITFGPKVISWNLKSRVRKPKSGSPVPYFYFIFSQKEMSSCVKRSLAQHLPTVQSRTTLFACSRKCDEPHPSHFQHTWNKTAAQVIIGEILFCLRMRSCTDEEIYHLPKTHSEVLFIRLIIFQHAMYLFVVPTESNRGLCLNHSGFSS